MEHRQIVLDFRFTDRLESSLTYELERHGEGGIDQSHPLDAPPGDTWTPLSGITESQHRFTLGLDYTLIGCYAFSADITHVSVQNLGNRKGMKASGQQLALKALMRF